VRRTSGGTVSEALATTLFFVVVAYGAVGTDGGLWSATAAGAIILAMAVAYGALRRNPVRGSLWAVLVALAGALWLLRMFVVAGLLAWPLNRAANLSDYLFLLYSHLVFALTVLAALVWAAWIIARNEQRTAQGAVPASDTAVSDAPQPPEPSLQRLRQWARWGRMDSPALTWALRLVPLACWVWAGYTVLNHPVSVTGWMMLSAYVVVALTKALLTAVTEEVCYRGAIQQCAVAQYGVVLGIVLQAAVYTAFHVNLGAAFFGRYGFIASVFSFGLIAGIVTQLRGGIGWALNVHMAIDMVIEWSNLS